MIPVAVTVVATDNVDPAPVCRLVTITSNESTGSTDAVITGPLTASLRADRLGTGNGRVYRMTIRCTDASGNATAATVNVTVPHDQGR